MSLKTEKPLPIKNIFEAYHQAKSKHTKELLRTLFRSLNKKIKVSRLDGVSYETNIEKEGTKGRIYIYSEGSQIIYRFFVSSDKVESFGYVRARDLPMDFLEKVQFFKEDEKAG